MAKQVEIKIDQALYDRLLELQVAPYSDINAVIERLLYHSGHKSREVQQLEAEEHHFSFDEEVERDRDGVYVSSGISS